MMSMRAEFLGDLQNGEALYSVHRLISVPPLREPQLREVVNRPAELLYARFETDHLAGEIARRTAEGIDQRRRRVAAVVVPVGRHVDRDGPPWRRHATPTPAAMEIGSVLVDRADKFLADAPEITRTSFAVCFTLKLATVREGGEPTRRHALRSEFTDGGMAVGFGAGR